MTPPRFIDTKKGRFISIWGVVLIALALVLGFEWWRLYLQGNIVATARSFSTEPIQNITAYIREYPTDLNPLLSDGNYYGCEVYRDHILMSAASFGFDSYTAKRFRIEIVPPREVHFYIDDAYHIICSGTYWGGSQWSQSW